MINIIWGVLIIIGIVFGVVSGNTDNINNEIIVSAKGAMDLVLGILPVLVLWMGLMKIAENSGLLQKIANFFTPILKHILPSVKKGDKAIGYIASNIAVNMAGLGNAATPLGLKAMSELQKSNEKKDTASEAMITFIILNTAGVTIVPTTIISLRVFYGSIAPTEILIPCLIATFSSLTSALLLDYIIRKRSKK